MEEEQSSRKTRRSWKQSNISSFEVEEEDDVDDGEVERAMGVGMESQFVGRWHAMLLTCADYMPSCLHAAYVPCTCASLITSSCPGQEDKRVGFSSWGVWRICGGEWNHGGGLMYLCSMLGRAGPA